MADVAYRVWRRPGPDGGLPAPRIRRVSLPPFPPRPLVVARPRVIEGPGSRATRAGGRFDRRASPRPPLAPCALRRGVRRLRAGDRTSVARCTSGRPTDERRPMPTQAKAAVIDEITERFQNSSAAELTEYRGLTVAQLTQLRRSLGAGSSYPVVKNTLTKRAAESVGFSDLSPLLNGPTAIAFIEGDPVEAAKAIRDFARTHPLLVVKGGVVDGRTVDASEVPRLADVEPREVLLAKLAGAMKGNLTKAAGLFQAPLSQVARLAAALQEKKPAEAAPADEAPAADTAAADTTPDTDAAADAAGDD